jgi:hypothetical protein
VIKVHVTEFNDVEPSFSLMHSTHCGATGPAFLIATWNTVVALPRDEIAELLRVASATLLATVQAIRLASSTEFPSQSCRDGANRGCEVGERGLVGLLRFPCLLVRGL